MDVQGQTILANQKQVTSSDNAGKKGPVQVLSAAGGKTEDGSVSFGQLLVQIIGTAKAPDEAVNGLSAVPLLTDLAFVLPSEASSDDLESNQQILELFALQPQLADLLKNDEDFEQWLVRVSELLQGMQLIPQPVVQTPEAGGQGIVETSAGKEQQIPAIQAQHIIKAFQQAVSENPNSVLLAQLTDDLAKLVGDRLPEASVPVKEQGISLLANEVREPIKAEAAPIHSDRRPDGSVPVKELVAFTGTNRDQAQTKASATSVNTGMQTVTGESHALHLEMLAAKASFSDRYSKDQGQQESQTNSPVLKDFAAVSDTGPISVHELLKLAQPGKPAAETIASTPGTLVQDLSRFVTARFKVNDLNGFAEARLTLTPESLGQVEVKLSMQGGQLVAHFAAHTAVGKEMLEAQLMNLRSALQNQGIQVEKLEVTQNGFLQSGMFQEQRHQQSSQQFTRRNKSSSNEQFEDSYNTEAINLSQAIAASDRVGFEATV